MNEVPKEAFRRQFWALLPVYINVLMTGCASGWLPNAIYFFGVEKEVPVSSYEYSLIASCSDLGKMGFAIPGGFIIDRFGRKQIIICAGILNFSCWLALSLHSSLITICVVRILLGMSTSLVTTTSLIYIGEIASPEARGKLTSICHTFLTVGTLSQCFITILFSSYHSLSYWNTALSSLYFLSMVFLMETPNYLVSVSKPKEAKENLNHIRSGYTQNEVNVEFEKLQQYIEEENYRKHQTSWLTFIKSKAIRKPLIIIIVLNFLSSAIGRSVISSYITLIYPRDIFIPVQFYPLIGELIQLVVSVFTVFYIDRFSRRSIFMVGSGIMAVTMLLCAFTNYEWVTYNDNISKWLFLFGNVFSGMISNGFIHPVRNAVQSEILPQTVKGFGGSLSIIFMAFGNVMSFQLYRLIKDTFGLYFLYLIFSVNSAILGIFLYLCLPEGRGKYLAEINFRDKATSSETA